MDNCMTCFDILHYVWLTHNKIKIWLKFKWFYPNPTSRPKPNPNLTNSQDFVSKYSQSYHAHYFELNITNNCPFHNLLDIIPFSFWKLFQNEIF